MSDEPDQDGDEPDVEDAPAARRGRPPWVYAALAIFVVAVAGIGILVFTQVKARQDEQQQAEHAKQAKDRYCPVYDATSGDLQAFTKVLGYQINLAERADSLAEAERAVEAAKAAKGLVDKKLTERRDAAPVEIQDDWQVLIDPVPEGGKLSDEQRRKDAVTAVNAYAVQHCNLPGDM